jgi:hypothetical protein
VVGTDEWRPSDDFLMAYLARVSEQTMNEYEISLYRHHRYMALKEQ